MLLTALLAVQATYTAKADVINSGHYYDTGKEMYSDMDNPHHDDYYCWATTASNLVQYWQDTEEHLKLANNQTTTPNGIEVKDGVSPYGTSYLKIYSDFLDHTHNTVETDKGEWQSQFMDWYFGGKTVIDATDHTTAITTGGGGYYTTNYGADKKISVKETSAAQMSLETFTNFITTAIDNNPGGAVGLDVQRTTPTKGHAITCWGYELDKDGKISSIIVTDSDDKYFGATRLNVVKGQNGNVALLYDNKIIKQDTPDQEVYFLGRDFQEDSNYVYRLTAITTKNDTAPYVAPKTEIPVGGEVTENTRLTKDQTVTGTVTVGDGNTVVVLTTDSGKKLTIAGSTVGEPTALDIKRGALVSVDSLVVMDSPVGGVHAVGNLHVGGSAASGDTATFTGNDTKGNGGAILNESFVDISGNDTVVFADNNADVKGGAIYSRGTDDNPQTYDNTTVSIHGNGSVTFSGNMSGQGGNDIYVEKGAFLNIADNESVIFKAAKGHEGEAAIVNKGETYLSVSANKDWSSKEFIFDNCSVDSREGTVYVGRNINNFGIEDTRCGWGTLTFKNDDGDALGIGMVYDYEKDAVPVKLQNVLITATGIYGNEGSIEKSLVSNMWTDKSLTSNFVLENLTLDTSNQLITSEAITLSNVNIALGEGDFDQDNYIFNLSNLFQTNTEFAGAVTFDASSLALPLTEDQELIVQLSKAVDEQQAALTILKFGNDLYEFAYLTGELNNQMVYSKIDPVPEPATGTLSLLALAGLCAPRRRK